MTLDYTKMLFAVEVRKLAAEIRREHREIYLKQYQGASKATQGAAWDKEYPLPEFFPLALMAFQQAADAIDRLGPDFSGA